MSNPYEQQPRTPYEPWAGQQPAPPPLQQNMAQYPYGQPTPPVKHGNGLAITALVVAVLALLLGVGGFVSQIFVGALFGMSSPGGPFGSSGGGPTGTAPQVVSGQEYPGRQLENEVTRVTFDDGLDVTKMSCPATPVVVADAVTVCHGTVDGADWSFRVTFEDGLGHFSLDEKVS